MLPRARKALLSAMWIICVFYYYSFWPLVLHQKGDVIIMQQKELYNVCTYIMTSQEQLERSPDRTWWTKGTLHMHIKRRSSLFVSYLYNYFKISTDFGFPFREKSIKPCSPGLSGWVSYHHIVTTPRANRWCVDQPTLFALQSSRRRRQWGQYSLIQSQTWIEFGNQAPFAESETRPNWARKVREMILFSVLCTVYCGRGCVSLESE